MKIRSNYGRVKTGAKVIVVLRFSNAIVAKEDQVKLSFLTKSIKATTIEAYPFTNRL